MAKAPTRIARLLGVVGLVPFVAGATSLWLLPWDQRSGAAMALSAYAATIAAFLGGLHWGLAASSQQSTWQYVWGVIPSLLAAVALLLPPPAALALLAGVLVACYAVDRRVLPSQGLAAWMPMRALLTAVASVSCLAAAFAMR